MKQQAVAIIGGGLGGLCLANGLKKAGISVMVYERDQSPESRPQGYRIHIDPQGSTALHECLPQHLWDLFQFTGGEFSQGFSVVTEQLHELLHLARTEDDADTIARHRSISRITLRRILLAGLDDVVKFDKRFLRYEEASDGAVIAHFEDGTTAKADLLVAADGVNSRVRKQYLPHAEPIDTGSVTIAGTLPLSDGVMALAPHLLLDGPLMVVPSSPCSMFMAMWKRSGEAAESLRSIGIEGPLPGDEDYLILGLGGRPEFFGIDERSGAVSGTTLKGILRRAAANWHPNLRKLVAMVDEEQLSLNHVRTSQPPRPWRATHVTLLGDAIHSMTPYRGVGGNIALKDAALLAANLIQAQQGKKPWEQAIAEYETSMRQYAFAAVEDSLKAMKQFTGPKRNPAFSIFKTGMRVANAVPQLKRKLLQA
ncbi:MAG TPA: FAD-dependent monooxygenase [Acidobacteriaceae bacterium]|nr:FAD-dependent monooxygenase [Acidobacteriaceae bacterium]